MTLRRLHHEQPDSFAFTPANLEWAERQFAKYPEGRQMSAVIPLLWRAQEQEGWVTRPMIHAIAGMLGMDPIRVLEVATFYYMFHLQPVGSIAHVQICGTTSCMLCGAEDLVAVCRERIAPEPYGLSADGKLSWEEVECIGACANAPVVQIGKDYYEDLTAESFGLLLDALVRGEVPRPGSQTGRWASEPVTGRTALAGDPEHAANASVELALAKGDTIARITGEENGGRRGRNGAAAPAAGGAAAGHVNGAGEPAGQAAPDAVAHTAPDRKDQAEKAAPLRTDEAETADETGKQAAAERQSHRAPAHGDDGSSLPPHGDGEAAKASTGAPAGAATGATTEVEADTTAAPAAEPARLDAPREGSADDLKVIIGIGPKLEELLNGLGIWHFDQIAGWGPAELAWLDEHLVGFHGRAERDDWVGQAKALAEGEDEGAGPDGSGG